MSEYEALLRMRVARASRKYPVLLDTLADGRLHLSGIDKLAPHLTADNYETVLARAAHQSKRKIEELVAELSPKPDVPSSIRKLPNQQRKAKPQRANTWSGPSKARRFQSSTKQTGRERPVPSTTFGSSQAGQVEPLAPASYKITFTASAELRDKLEKLRSLMRSSVPDGDLAALIEEAVTEKIEKLESRRYGTTKNPRKDLEETDTSASSRYIPAPVRRAVYERDQHRCTFVDPSGRRCDETEWLEFHHVEPYGRGGDHSPDNIFLMSNRTICISPSATMEKKRCSAIETPRTEFPNQRLYTLSVIDLPESTELNDRTTLRLPRLCDRMNFVNEPLSKLVLFHLEVITRLQVHPKAPGCPKVACEP